MGLLEDIIKGMTQGQGSTQGDVFNQGGQQNAPIGQSSDDISIEDLERQMGIGNKNQGSGYQQQYPQQYPQQQQGGYPQQQGGYPQQYPQQQQGGYPQQQTGGSGIPGLDDYLPTTQNDNLPTQQQQLPGCSGGSAPGCSGGLWKMLGIGALLAFLFRRKN